MSRIWDFFLSFIYKFSMTVLINFLTTLIYYIYCIYIFDIKLLITTSLHDNVVLSWFEVKFLTILHLPTDPNCNFSRATAHSLSPTAPVQIFSE